VQSIARLAAFAIAALAVACGSSAGPAPANQGSSANVGATVTYRNFAVSPTGVEVKAGEAVAFKNEDSQQHTVSGGRPGAN